MDDLCLFCRSKFLCEYAVTHNHDMCADTPCVYDVHMLTRQEGAAGDGWIFEYQRSPLHTIVSYCCPPGRMVNIHC